MRFWPLLTIVAVLLTWLQGAPVQAQRRSLTLSSVHICCPMCEKAIREAVGKVDQVNAEVNRDEKSVTLTFDEGATRRDAAAALEAIAKAGFYGKSNRARIQMKDESAGLDGKVSSLTVTGIHNCCGQCVKAIQGVVADVEGAQPAEVAGKVRELTVNGDFDAAALVQAFNKAGFYVTVKK